MSAYENAGNLTAAPAFSKKAAAPNAARLPPYPSFSPPQSPFIGKSADAASVLYPQFTSVDAVLLDAPAEDAAPAGAGGGAAESKPKRQKAKRKQQEEGAGGGDGDTGGEAVAAAPDAAAAADADAVSKRKQRGKRAKKVAVQPSGPGNAEEAAAMRAALGFDGGTAAPVAAAPEVAAAAPAGGTFSFGFAVAADDATALPLDGATPADALATLPGPPAAAADDATPAKRERRPRGGRAAAASTSSTSLARRVFVGGMPFAYEEEDVREYWEWCGPIASLDLMRFPDTGRFRGIAFLTFATDEGYTKALECDGTMLDGVRVKVEPCKTAKRGVGGPDARAPSRAHAGPAPKTPGYNVAYVGNIAFEATVEDLAALFEGVTRVRLHTDKLTGRSKGYAHIHFRDGDALDAAVAQDGVEVMGRGVRVSYAQPKKEDGVGVAEA